MVLYKFCIIIIIIIIIVKVSFQSVLQTRNIFIFLPLLSNFLTATFLERTIQPICAESAVMSQSIVRLLYMLYLLCCCCTDTNVQRRFWASQQCCRWTAPSSIVRKTRLSTPTQLDRISLFPVVTILCCLTSTTRSVSNRCSHVQLCSVHTSRPTQPSVPLGLVDE